MEQFLVAAGAVAFAIFLVFGMRFLLLWIFKNRGK